MSKFRKWHSVSDSDESSVEDMPQPSKTLRTSDTTKTSSSSAVSEDKVTASATRHSEADLNTSSDKDKSRLARPSPFGINHVKPLGKVGTMKLSTQRVRRPKLLGACSEDPIESWTEEAVEDGVILISEAKMPPDEVTKQILEEMNLKTADDSIRGAADG